MRTPTMPRRTGAIAAALTLALTPALIPGVPGVPGVTGTAHADVVRERQQPVLDSLDVAGAWKTTRGAGATVAVVDSGVAADQIDLRGSVTTGPNLLARIDAAGPPRRRHGTGMASLIAGHGHGPGGGDGIIGIAPNSRILALRVIAEPEDPGFRVWRSDRRLEGTVAAGVRYAADHDADVINLSLGKYQENPKEREAIAYAISKGVVVVAAVGNDGDKRRRLDENGFAPYSYPAAYPGVIAVAATDPGHSRAGFSNRNYSVLLSAPGVDIPVALPDGDYGLSGGTSDATALVSGIAALIRSRYRNLPPALVAQSLVASTRFGPSGSYDAAVGFGEVNAGRALAAAGRLSATPPGSAGVSSGQRFGPGEHGPVAIIDRPAWTKPALVAIIGTSVGGAGTAILVAVLLFRRSPRVAPAAWPSPAPVPTLPPPIRPPLPHQAVPSPRSSAPQMLPPPYAPQRTGNPPEPATPEPAPPKDPGPPPA